MVAGCILAVTVPATSGRAQDPGERPDTTRTTRSGAYTAAQALSGKEIYALNCISCHAAATHTGPLFVGKWEGRSLWELYQYIRESMPKSEPGSLSAGEYSRVLAYLLRMNGAPSGSGELTPDSTALKQIRIELKPR